MPAPGGEVTATGRRLKAATADLIDASPKLEAAAADIGKGKSQVQRYYSPTAPDFINVHDVALLEARASRPFVTEQLCRIAGGVFVPLPDPGAGEDAVTLALVDASAEFGDVADELRKALADRRLVEREREAIAGQIDEAVAALMRMRAVLYA